MMTSRDQTDEKAAAEEGSGTLEKEEGEGED